MKAIPRVEIDIDKVERHHLELFANQGQLLVQLFWCKTYKPSSSHKYAISSKDLAPDHVQWLRDEMDGWCLIQYVPDEFIFWFTDESDALYFKLNFS